jgi:UDP-glucose 4-epimerase
MNSDSADWKHSPPGAASRTEEMPATMNHRLSPRRVLVLGGTGFLGSEIAGRFIDQGSSVAVLARHGPTGIKGEKLRTADLVLGAAEDEEVLERGLEDADHVVHALGCPLPAESNGDPADDLLQTVPTLVRILEMLRRRPGISLTFLSSGGTVYGSPVKVPADESTRCDPITAYGITKLAAEKYIGMYSDRYGIDARILRISNAYGPLQSPERGQGLIAAFLGAARSGHGVRIFGDGTALRDYVTVEDVANAVVQLYRCLDGPRVLNVGSGTGHSVRDVLAIVGHVTGHPLHVDWLPERLFDVKAIVLDVTTLHQLIAWSPVPLEEGIPRIWNTWQSWSAPLGEDLPL